MVFLAMYSNTALSSTTFVNASCFTIDSSSGSRRWSALVPSLTMFAAVYLEPKLNSKRAGSPILYMRLNAEFKRINISRDSLSILTSCAPTSNPPSKTLSSCVFKTKGYPPSETSSFLSFSSIDCTGILSDIVNTPSSVTSK